MDVTPDPTPLATGAEPAPPPPERAGLVAPHRVAGWLVGCLAVMAPIQAVAAFEHFYGRELVGRIMAGGLVDTAPINRYLAVTTVVSIAVSAALAVLTMWWGYRTVAVARDASSGFHDQPLWAVLAWLPPLANLVLPLLVLLRAHRASRSGRTPGATAVLGFWWGCLVAAVAATTLSGVWYLARSHQLAAETAASYAAADRSLQNALTATGAASVLELAAALFLLAAVRRITAAQHDWLAGAEALDVPPSAPGTADDPEGLDTAESLDDPAAIDYGPAALDDPVPHDTPTPHDTATREDPAQP